MRIISFHKFLVLIQDKLLGIKKVAGVEVILASAKEMEYNYVLLSLDKGIISIENQQIGLKNIEELRDRIPDDIPISLVINGRGLLIKKITGKMIEEPAPHLPAIRKANTRQAGSLSQSEAGRKEIIHALLPNAKAEDFYFQITSAYQGNFTSIARKDLIDDLLISLKQAGYYVITASLGPFCISNIVPLLEESLANGELSMAGHALEFKDNLIDKYVFTSPPAQAPPRLSQKGREKNLKERGVRESDDTGNIKIGEEEIDTKILLAYAAGFQVLLQNIEIASLNIPKVGKENEEFFHKRLFKVLGWGLLIFFLFVLLINFMFYNYHFNKNQQLTATVGNNQSLLTQLNKLKNEVKDKEYFLSHTGWLEPSMTSFYADQIAGTVPKSINLTKLTVNPIDDKLSKKVRKLIFQAGIITISGNCKKNTDLNEWIKILRDFEWAGAVSIQNYVYDNKKRRGNFDIEVKTSP